MTVDHPIVGFEDHRGRITDILNGEPVEHVAHFTCRAGALRGNHYHKQSVAHVFVLSGRFSIHARLPGSEVEQVVAGPGDLVTLEPLERHALLALEDSSFLMLVHGPQGGRQFQGDTVREAP